jgi:hypothetical protein
MTTPFGTWLAEIGLGRCDDVFVSNGIDFDVVRSLSDADLRELGPRPSSVRHHRDTPLWRVR